MVNGVIAASFIPNIWDIKKRGKESKLSSLLLPMRTLRLGLQHIFLPFR